MKNSAAHTQRPLTIPPLMLYVLAFVAAIVCCVTPLHRVAGTPFMLSLPTSRPLEVWGLWLPADLHLLKDAAASRISSGYLEFLLLMTLAFGAYGLFALLILRQHESANFTRVLRFTWLGAIIAGLIFVFTPAMLSHDVFVYAGFGRILAVYHANPYFVPLTTFPHDPFITIDDWKGATAAYGPLWVAITALGGLLLGNDPLHSIFAYRLLGLAAHLLNSVLIYTILRTMQRTPRTVALGVLLYTWNPLALLENCLGSHNDVLMVTLLLWGLLLCLRAEQRGVTRPSSYLPPLAVLTLATLIKFTAAPLIIFALVLLFHWAGAATLPHAVLHKDSGQFRRRNALKLLCIAVLFCSVLALASYLPFWLGHSPRAILLSFTTPPSAYAAYGSILFAIQRWLHTHATNSPLLVLLGQHSLWNGINGVVLVCALALGVLSLWRYPTVRTVVLAALGTLSLLLVVTPWFFPWYVVWLIGLFPLCLPIGSGGLGRGLIAFTLTFSLSVLAFYPLNLSLPPIGGWVGFTFLYTLAPPIVAFAFFVFVRAKNTCRGDPHKR